MPYQGNELSANKAWERLFERYNIVEHVSKYGTFYIKASQIKAIKEPRLMAKWDSSSSLPEVFRKNRINILPCSRNMYILSDFILYQEIPELEEHVTQMPHVDLPNLESIDVNNISSEANAINVLALSGILDDFLGTDQNIATFSGRMGSGVFRFEVDTYSHVPRIVEVVNAQCEIDGGFENSDSVVIIEAKNVVHEDFHIRQLYYPYRLWKTKVKKPIRLVFSVYSNMIYRLFEYKFNDLDNYSSIELVQSKNYSLQDTTITFEELSSIRDKTKIITDDNKDATRIPFIQANSLDRVVSLLENLYENPMTKMQIAELMDFDKRQSDYYFNAGKYLGLFQSYTDDDDQILVALTPLGKQIFRMNYKERQLKLVECILQHQIFADFYDCIVKNGNLPTKLEIEAKMREYHVCGEGQIERRASSVYGWLRWIVNLTKLY